MAPGGQLALVPALLGGSVEPSGASYRLDAAGQVVGVHDARPSGETDYGLVWDSQAQVPQVLSVGSGGSGEFSDFRYGVDRVSVDGAGAGGVFGVDVYGNSSSGSGAAGSWVQAGSYSVFGEPAGRDPDAGGVTFGFQGELVLPSGELYLRARSYDPSTGSFLQPDPLGGVAGASTVSNRYHYADNDPVNRADPLGLRVQGKHSKNGWLSLGLGVGVGVACVVGTAGTLTPACVGAGLGVYSGVDSYQEHCLDGQAMTSCLSHVATDAGIGFVEGYLSTVAFSGVAAVLGDGLVGMTAAGGAGAFTQSGINQILRTGQIDVGRLARDTAIGAATGGVLHGVSKAAESFSSARQAASARAMERQIARQAPVIETVDQTALRAPALARTETGAITTRPTRAGPAIDKTRSSFPLNTPRALPSGSTVNNAGSPIRSFVTESDQTYYRVFSGQNRTGGFLTAAPPASADDAVLGLALPPGNRADFIQEVTVPAGTRLQSSVATEAFGRPGGLLQFELIDLIDPKNFGAGTLFR